MSLSNFERAVLINQLTILKAVDSKNAAHYDESIDIFTRGYVSFYDDAMGNLEPPVTPQDTRFVVDVLSMFRALDAYLREHPEDKTAHESQWIRFSGFDGNNEIAYYSFARFLMLTQGKFEEQLVNQQNSDGFNSHSEMASVYRRMLQVYSALEPTTLTSENVASILASVKDH